MKSTNFALILAFSLSCGMAHGLDCPNLQDLVKTRNQSIPAWAPREAALMKTWTDNYDFYLQVIAIRDSYGGKLSDGAVMTYQFEDGRTANRTVVTSAIHGSLKLNNTIQSVNIDKIKIPAEGMHIEESGIFMRVNIYAPQSKYKRTYATSGEVPLDGRLMVVKETRLERKDFPLPTNFAANQNEFVAIIGADGNNYSGDQYGTSDSLPATVLAITRVPKNIELIRRASDQFQVGQHVSLIGNSSQTFQILAVDRDNGLLKIKSVQKYGNMNKWAHVFEVQTVMGQSPSSTNPYKVGEQVIQINDGSLVTSSVGAVQNLGGSILEIQGLNYTLDARDVKALNLVPSVCGVKVGDRVQLAANFYKSQPDFSSDDDSSDAGPDARKQYLHARITELNKCVATVKGLDDSGFANLSWDKTSCDFRAFSQSTDNNGEDYDRLNWIHLSALNRAQ